MKKKGETKMCPTKGQSVFKKFGSEWEEIKGMELEAKRG